MNDTPEWLKDKFDEGGFVPPYLQDLKSEEETESDGLSIVALFSGLAGAFVGIILYKIVEAMN